MQSAGKSREGAGNDGARFGFACRWALALVTVVMTACGGETAPPVEWIDSASDRFCRATTQHVDDCGDSSASCESGLSSACSGVAAVFSDEALENLAACTDGGDSPLSCLSRVSDDLAPGEAHKAFARRFCDQCAPGAESCADSFYEDPSTHSTAALVLPLNEATLDEVGTTCAAKPGCADDFSECVEKVLTDKGIPDDTVTCSIDAWTKLTLFPVAACSTASGSSTPPGPTVEAACLDQSIALFPLSLTGGDREFMGHGPNVKVTVDVSAPAATKIAFKACVTMKETESDWSAGTKCVTKTITHPHSGIAGPTHFDVAYTDHDHYADDAILEHTKLHNAGFVQSVKCIGDRDGEDICSSSGCSRCDVKISCIDVNSSPH